MKLNGLENYFKTNENGIIVDFKQVNNNMYTPLLFCFYYNILENLNLNEIQLDYLLKNSDLKQVSKYGNSALIFALFYNKKQKLNLNNKQWKYLIYNSDLSLVKNEEELLELKKIQSELLNEELLNNINNNKIIRKVNKI